MSLIDPVTAKVALRVFVRNRRKQLALEHPQADWRVVDVAREPLTQRFPEPAGKVAALYFGMGSEIATGHLADWLASQGWTLALPSVEGRQGRMVFRRWTPGDPLERDSLGLVAPAADQPVLIPDLVVVPSLAFDRKGVRLGQGGGYYDRVLAMLRARRPVFVLGLAYAGQETQNLPVEDHDQRLDAILTETEYIAVRKD